MGILDKLKKEYKSSKIEMTVEEYLKNCKNDSKYYASAAERLLKSIGEATVIDTKEEQRSSRIHFNKKIKIYPAFSEFYGMESVIDNIVSFFKHSPRWFSKIFIGRKVKEVDAGRTHLCIKGGRYFIPHL